MMCLTVSDEIVPAIYSPNVKQRFGAVQCVLSCGDLPYYYLEFIVTMLCVPCYYVAGNHDTVEICASGDELTAPRGCVSVEMTCVMHQGLLIGGLGGCMRYNQEPGPQYTEGEMLIRMWRMTPRLIINRLRYGRYLDVLLTHAPPLGIHNGPDRAHRGFRTFLLFMDLFAPRYLIHGHIHRSYGVREPWQTRYRRTMVINTAGYRLLSLEPAKAGVS
ncbi:MAG: metallophosphoesterase [Roseiflexaceae bacterium]|nr:metallophosphoesterase [Roseiflexaceae bacterium]